jgi:hypothetical protein
MTQPVFNERFDGQFEAAQISETIPGRENAETSTRDFNNCRSIVRTEVAFA